jgi:hypothetical protein
MRANDEIRGWATEQKSKFAEFQDASGAEVFAAANDFLAAANRYGVPAAIQVVQEKAYSFRPQFIKKGA